MQLMQPSRLESIDFLRAFAALSVCFFHFTNGNELFLSNHFWLKQIGSFGWAGVQIFFVISGFVIPYSLFVNKYRLTDSKIFLLKRLIRIEPPYLLTLVLCIILNYLSTLSPLYQGNKFSVDIVNIAMHLGYLNSFFSQEWVNPSFWTLAIEFQFYILIAFIFPLLVYYKIWVRYLMLLILLISSITISNNGFIFPFLPFFVAGILLFYYKCKLVSDKGCCWSMTIVFSQIYFCHGMTLLIFTLFACVCIAFLRKIRFKWMLWLGIISYSLYLIHIPIGGRIINLSMNFFQGNVTRSLVVLTTLTTVILISYYFYKMIEEPFLRISKSLRKGETIDA